MRGCLFAGNDFLGLNRHPTIAKATVKVLLEKSVTENGKKEQKINLIQLLLLYVVCGDHFSCSDTSGLQGDGNPCEQNMKTKEEIKRVRDDLEVAFHM
ncbi:hypothetical protein V6N13_098813 [Hibiscus sabdariffa]|uniref:Uncharacterized protein n=1 Tax=Hibiscus sabdariffa TaxID=183260 RepID=A0ABR2EIP3_9ROSI